MFKHSSDEIKEDEDYISRLPEEILTQILSLLPKADAKRTRILSSRWKDPWAFLPNLHFVMPVCWSTEHVHKFHNSVDQTLALRGGMPIQNFFIYCSRGCDYIRVYDCLHTVVKCQVKKLEVRFPPDKYRVKFCWRLFRTCHTLVELTLKGEFLLHVPEASLLFPSLKKINLVAIDCFSGYETLENLLFGCPVLEELCVERQVSIDKYQTIKVSSSSLKKLRISFTEAGFGDCVFMIDAPKLEYLYIEDYMFAYYSFTDPLSIAEAHISAISASVAQLVTCLISAKILTLSASTISGIPPFSPSWDPPVEAPACLCFKKKEIIILNRKAVRQEELISIRYLLKHSSTLERMTINAHAIDSKTCDQLLNFYRGSGLCQIEFV